MHTRDPCDGQGRKVNEFRKCGVLGRDTLETFERLAILIEPDRTREELAELPKAKMQRMTPDHA
jgi:hypothetical protein